MKKPNIKLILEKYSKSALAEKLGISRPTLNVRLKLGNWKKGELSILNSLIHE